jgi:RNA polymerase sigma factor (sigma-70 family)
MPKLLQSTALRQIQRVFGEGTAIGLSDAQLLERFAGDRDEAAFEALVARHGPMVLGACRGVLHNPHDAEDAFQATFLVLARQARSLWVKGSLASWLYQIAVRIAVQARADAERRRRLESQAADVRERQDDPAGRLEPDLILMLYHEIDRLPEKYRAPVILCHLEELTHEAAAQMLRCPIGTVHGRLSRARDLLRRRLSRRGVALPAGLAACGLSGGSSLAAAVPDPLRYATLRAALNLAAGQGISTAVGSTSAGALLAATLRTMTLSTLKTAAATILFIGLAVGAWLSIGRSPAVMLGTADEPARPRPETVKQPPPRTDAEAIQGTWVVTTIEQVSHQSTEDEKAYFKTGQCTITITADQLTFDVDKSRSGYRLVPTTTPKRMLFTMTDDPRGLVVAIAIYELEGDNLKICLGRKGEFALLPQAPHGFDIKSAPPGTFPTLFVMKRKPPYDPSTRRRRNRPLPAKFDEGLHHPILRGGKDEPLFVNLETGFFLSPPFDLEPADPSRPLALPNLAFPEKLKGWIRRHGVDAIVQTDGLTITLLGLEMEDGQPVPNPNAWPFLTPADTLRLIDPFPDQPRPPDVAKWPRFARTFRKGDPPFVLPFLTREGSIGILELRMHRAEPKDAEGIRLTYQIGRGLLLPDEVAAPRRTARQAPTQALLDDRAGFVSLQVWKGGIVLTRPGYPEWIEVDQGKVVVKVNRAGPSDTAETLIEASRLVTDVMDLDGRRLRVTLLGRAKGMICRRVRDRLEIGEDPGWFLARKLEVRENPVISCDRITLDLPDFQKLSKDPDAIVDPTRRREFNPRRR